MYLFIIIVNRIVYTFIKCAIFLINQFQSEYCWKRAHNTKQYLYFLVIILTMLRKLINVSNLYFYYSMRYERFKICVTLYFKTIYVIRVYVAYSHINFNKFNC